MSVFCSQTAENQVVVIFSVGVVDSPFAMFLYALVLYPVASSPEFLTPFTIAAFKFPFAIWVALQIGQLSDIENDRYDLLLKILIVAALIACLISFILCNSISIFQIILNLIF